MYSNDEVYRTYGKDVIVSRKGAFVLVHMDDPTPALVAERTREFDPEEYFFDGCPLCLMLKESGVVIFDDSIFEDGDDVLE